jgi:hypothetical protein
MGWLPAAALAMALSGSAADDSSSPRAADEFHFARMIYVDNGMRGFGRGWWQQDYPDAEINFIPNLTRMTRVRASVEGSKTVSLTDEELFDYPWLYATQTGYWELSDEELDPLREYLLRGGFLMCDDFWGDTEWEVFAATMARLFPTREIEELHGDDAVLHVVFSIDEFTQIPGHRHLLGNGQIQQLPTPGWYGIYDDNRRLMVGINYNQDVGDSWEHADSIDYPQPMTALGYRFGINYIVYAMTH